MHSGSTVASKNLAIRMDVVKRLDLLKRPGESYSDVIERYMGERLSLKEALDYAREHPVEGVDTIGPRIREIRKQMDRDFEKRRKRLEEMP